MTMPENEWFIDENDSLRFRHEGWEIVRHDPASPANEPYITCPLNDCEADYTDEGIMVFGEQHHGGYMGYSAVRFTVPWRIIEALVQLRAGKAAPSPLPTMNLGEVERRIKADVGEATAEAEDAAVERHAGHLVGRRVRYAFHERDTHEADGVVRGVSLDSETEVLAFSVESRSRNSGHTVTRDMSRYAILGWLEEEGS